jgi:hypothetical protein
LLDLVIAVEKTLLNYKSIVNSHESTNFLLKSISKSVESNTMFTSCGSVRPLDS